MPAPPVMRAVGSVARALRAGKLTMYEIDTRVRTILELANYAIDSQIPTSDRPQSPVRFEFSPPLFPYRTVYLVLWLPDMHVNMNRYGNAGAV